MAHTTVFNLGSRGKEELYVLKGELVLALLLADLPVGVSKGDSEGVLGDDSF